MGLKKTKTKRPVAGKSKRRASAKARVVKRARVITRKSGGGRKRSVAISQGQLTAAVVAGVLVVAVGLWRASKPAEVPPPVMQLDQIVKQVQKPSEPVAPPPVREIATVPAEAQAPQVSAQNTAPVAAATEQEPLSEEFKKYDKSQLGDRIAGWSEFIWKAYSTGNYALSVFGKGPEVEDSAPLIPKKYDCTTYVETVAALSKSKNSKEFFKNLIAIRYRDSKTTYADRNHFPEIDWIPNNEKAGILKDITAQIGKSAGVAVKSQTKTINRGKWLAEQLDRGKVSRSLASLARSDWGKPVEAKVTYLDIGDIEKYMDKIPHGAVLNLVRRSHPDHPVLISHQGFVIRQGNLMLLRHSLPSGKIRTTALSDYLRTLNEKRVAVKWPAVGINFNQVQD